MERRRLLCLRLPNALLGRCRHGRDLRHPDIRADALVPPSADAGMVAGYAPCGRVVVRGGNPHGLVGLPCQPAGASLAAGRGRLWRWTCRAAEWLEVARRVVLPLSREPKHPTLRCEKTCSPVALGSIGLAWGTYAGRGSYER